MYSWCETVICRNILSKRVKEDRWLEPQELCMIHEQVVDVSSHPPMLVGQEDKGHGGEERRSDRLPPEWARAGPGQILYPAAGIAAPAAAGAGGCVHLLGPLRPANFGTEHGELSQVLQRRYSRRSHSLESPWRRGSTQRIMSFTLNKLFQLSSVAEIVLLSTDCTYRSVPNVQNHVCNVYVFQPSFHFAYRHCWLGRDLCTHPTFALTCPDYWTVDLLWDYTRSR